MSSFVSSCFNHLNGSHHRSHKAPNCSIIKFGQFNTMFVHYLFMLYIHTRHDHTCIPEGLTGRCFVGVRSRSAQKVPPGPKAKHFAAPLHGRKGWKVGRLEGEAVHDTSETVHLPSKVQDQAESGC